MTTKKSNESTVDGVKWAQKILVNIPFGEFLRSMRESDEITQTELARILGVTRQFINGIEQGRKDVSLKLAREIAIALGYSPLIFAKILLRSQLHDAGFDCEVKLIDKVS